MKVSRVLSWISLHFFALASLGFAAADFQSLSGVVRDGESKPLAGVRITLTGHEIPPRTYQTTSGPVGEFRFANLPTGEYTIMAELTGYISATSVGVSVHAASPAPTADLTLIKTSSAPAPGASARPPLEFQSAGIRGLIDPGGYSASTSGAATGLLRGIANINRTDASFGVSAAQDWPCALEPELRKAVVEHPDQLEANRKLGQFYAAHDQPASAIPFLDHALEIDGGDYVASRELAIVWLESGQFESARKLLSKLADGHARPEVHQLLARADEGSGMFQQAAQEYRAAASEEPSEESLFGVGYELLLAGLVPESLFAFEAGVERYPRSISLRIGEGTAQFLLGKTSAALRSFLDATDIDPADPRPYSFLARASSVSGDDSERLRNSFQRFLERQPGRADANYFYALELSRESGAAAASHAETLLKRAIQLDPNLAKAYLLLADVYAQGGEYEDAVPAYEAAVRLAPNLDEAHYRLALAYGHIGRGEESTREMQIFRLSKKRQATGNEGIEVAQFVSIMDAPPEQPSQELHCLATPHTPPARP